MTRDMYTALVGPTTSRRNKLALIAQCLADGAAVRYKWQCEPYRSRLLISIDWQPFQQCKSYDEDIRPYLEETHVLY